MTQVLGGSAMPIHVIGGDVGVYAPTYPEITNHTANYTLLASDASNILEFDGTVTVTLPNGMPTGYQVRITNIGIGVVTITAEDIVVSISGNLNISQQWGQATVYHAGANIWRATGDLTV